MEFKKRCLIILFLTVALVTTKSVWALSTEIIEKARNATVLISTEREDGTGGGFGSGVVVSPDGLVITNYHVIHRAKILRVWFYDPQNNNYYKASVLGIDPVADLALLQIEIPKHKLPLEYLKIETKGFKVADEVVAIGHPIGIQWTISVGHISSTDRTGKITPYIAVLQHSAEIHKGNSGGPLINEKGDIIGINTYILMPNDSWSGIAYAIKGGIVKQSLEQMLISGEVRYPAFKLSLRGLNEFGVKWLEENYPEAVIPKDVFGLIVLNLEEGDYAFEQGIRQFDVVVVIDGEPVNNMLDVRNIVMGGDYKEGQKVTLIIIRNRHFRKIEFVLGAIEFPYLKYYDEVDRVGPGKDIVIPEEENPITPEEEHTITPKEETPSEDKESEQPKLDR